jgi:hypothetical protein
MQMNDLSKLIELNLIFMITIMDKLIYFIIAIKILY